MFLLSKMVSVECCCKMLFSVWIKVVYKSLKRCRVYFSLSEVWLCFCCHWGNQFVTNKNNFTASWAPLLQKWGEDEICQAAKNYVRHRRRAPKGGLRNANCQSKWFSIDSALLLRVTLPLVRLSAGITLQVFSVLKKKWRFSCIWDQSVWD